MLEALKIADIILKYQPGIMDYYLSKKVITIKNHCFVINCPLLKFPVLATSENGFENTLRNGPFFNVQNGNYFWRQIR